MEDGRKEGNNKKGLKEGKKETIITVQEGRNEGSKERRNEGRDKGKIGKEGPHHVHNRLDEFVVTVGTITEYGPNGRLQRSEEGREEVRELG